MFGSDSIDRRRLQQCLALRKAVGLRKSKEISPVARVPVQEAADHVPVIHEKDTGHLKDIAAFRRKALSIFQHAQYAAKPQLRPQDLPEAAPAQAEGAVKRPFRIAHSGNVR